jgi:hypothetical protein
MFWIPLFVSITVTVRLIFLSASDLDILSVIIDSYFVQCFKNRIWNRQVMLIMVKPLLYTARTVELGRN